MLFIYSKLFFFKDESHNVSEAAVVGFPHDTLGEGIFAFVNLRSEHEFNEKEIIKELKSLVKSKISSYAIPHHFLVKYKNKLI